MLPAPPAIDAPLKDPDGAPQRPSSQPLGSPLPRCLRVLSQPRETFAEAARLQVGFGTLFGCLALEYALRSPVHLAGALLRSKHQLLRGVQMLASLWVQNAITPFFCVLLAGLSVFLMGRRRAPHSRVPKLDAWQAGCMLSYAYMPHLLGVCVAVLASGLGLGADPSGTPESPTSSPTLAALQSFLLWTPTAMWVYWALTSATTQETPTATAQAPVPALETSPAFERAATAPPRLRSYAVALAAVSLVLLASLAATLSLSRSWDTARPVVEGSDLPHFVAPGLTGAPLDSSSLLGKVAVIDFWASWCAPCVRSLPHLQALQAQLGGRGLQVVTVNVEPDNVPGVQQFVQRTGLTLPVYLDAGALRERFFIQGLPTSFLVDRQGEVRAVYTGPPDAAALQVALEALLGPTSAPPAGSGGTGNTAAQP
jgi:cytochrome c biogenesis protein CcmG/thiol:disulfide interchange protein DsbE